jgi:hypothetical protein
MLLDAVSFSSFPINIHTAFFCSYLFREALWLDVHGSAIYLVFFKHVLLFQKLLLLLPSYFHSFYMTHDPLANSPIPPCYTPSEREQRY